MIDRPMTSHSVALPAEAATRLQAYLAEHGYRPKTVPYALFAAEGEDVNVVYYQSGKLVVQGRGTRDFIEFVLEPEILKEARLGYETLHDPSLKLPRLGIDESGKGDYFGPLCVAGVYANERMIQSWLEAGVRDSKAIHSERRIGELADRILHTPGCVTAVVPIGNPAYNRLHAKIGNVNKLLAWGHARVIENLMQRRHLMVPPPVRAISDQFARNKAVLGRALMADGRQLELVQRHKAEADPVVAAASILARHEFTTRLAALEREFHLRLPKGASAEVEKAARALVDQHGPDSLARVAKLHFRTTSKILPPSTPATLGEGPDGPT